MDKIMEIWTNYLFTPEGGAVSVILAVLSVIGMWLVFKKAHKAGWRSLVPVLNLYTLVQIGDRHGLKFLLLLIPVVGVIYYVLFSVRLARRFGKGLLFGVGLMLLPPLFILILGLGSAKYKA
jgi:hypothetical protein